MNQAEHIIAKCGGHKIVAAWLDVHESRVLRWTYPKERGGTGGLIPARHHTPLLKIATQNLIELTPNDFFPTEEQT